MRGILQDRGIPGISVHENGRLRPHPKIKTDANGRTQVAMVVFLWMPCEGAFWLSP